MREDDEDGDWSGEVDSAASGLSCCCGFGGIGSLAKWDLMWPPMALPLAKRLLQILQILCLSMVFRTNLLSPFSVDLSKITKRASRVRKPKGAGDEHSLSKRSRKQKVQNEYDKS